MNEGREQLYGTQMRIVNGSAVPWPIEAGEVLDQRREQVGLEPLSEYVADFQQRADDAPANK